MTALLPILRQSSGFKESHFWWHFIRYSLASEKIVQLALLLFAVGEEQLDSSQSDFESDYDEAAGVPQIELANAIELAATLLSYF